jgi:hypothetical protein
MLRNGSELTTQRQPNYAPSPQKLLSIAIDLTTSSRFVPKADSEHLGFAAEYLPDKRSTPTLDRVRLLIERRPLAADDLKDRQGVLELSSSYGTRYVVT